MKRTLLFALVGTVFVVLLAEFLHSYVAPMSSDERRDFVQALVFMLIGIAAATVGGYFAWRSLKQRYDLQLAKTRVAIIVSIGIVVVGSIAYFLNLFISPETSTDRANFIQVLGLILGGVLGFIAILATASSLQSQQRTSFRPEGGETPTQRVNRLTTSLLESAHVIEEIQTEIRERDSTLQRSCKMISIPTIVLRN